MRIPSREPMSNRLVADLVFRHWHDYLIVYEQAIYVSRGVRMPLIDPAADPYFIESLRHPYRAPR
jgi:hypothetical protein